MNTKYTLSQEILAQFEIYNPRKLLAGSNPSKCGNPASAKVKFHQSEASSKRLPMFTPSAAWINSWPSIPFKSLDAGVEQVVSCLISGLASETSAQD